MKFDQVYDLLLNHQTKTESWYVVLAEQSLRQIYQHILATRATSCLELGTAFGATSCVMAAAVEEIGGGLVTTIDHMVRKPVGVAELAQATGLTQYIRAFDIKGGYNWFLLGVLQQQTKGAICEPCYDFCFLDGAHFWEPDALATLLVTKLLRPGGWLLMDDLHWKPRDHPGWETDFSYMSDDQVNTSQVGMVFDLLVKTHPDLDHFTLTNSTGWARKTGGPASSYEPDGVIAGPATGSWSQSRNGAEAIRDMPHGGGLTVDERGPSALIRATHTDPNIELNTTLVQPRAIDFVSLRLQLLSPDMASVQLFWIGEDNAFFDEARSTRCLVRLLREPQHLTFPIKGTTRERTIRAMRLDPADGPCELLLENVTFGTW
jgi:predicted O-methyltransferase YrrM